MKKIYYEKFTMKKFTTKKFTMKKFTMKKFTKKVDCRQKKLIKLEQIEHLLIFLSRLARSSRAITARDL